MANPPRKKGTGGEVEFRDVLDIGLERTSAGTTYDLHRNGYGAPLEVLATRPDRGQWLVTLRAEDFRHILSECARPLHVEVKRYKRFSLHSIFESKFGGK